MSLTKQLFSVDEHRLIKLVGQGTYPGAQEAWDKFLSIRAAGGIPTCFYSDSNGFTVLDDRDEDPEKVRRAISMEQRAKPFPG